MNSGTDSQGGYLVAPAYIQEGFVDLAVKTAPVLDLITRVPLDSIAGGKTDSVNIPKQTGAASVSYATQGSALPTADPTFDTVAATVFPFGGYVPMSGFLQRRSLPGADMLVLNNLGQQLWAKIGEEVINGSGPSAAFEGILQADSIGTATATAGTATWGDVWPALLNAILDVQTGAYTSPSAILMHPRRFAWLAAQTDADDRPLMGGVGPVNAPGTYSTRSEGYAGQILGVPIVLDNSVPTTLGAGTDEDRIIVADFKECWLVESPPMFAVDMSQGFASDNVGVRVLYDAAFTAERRVGAISVLSGTALNDTI